MDLEEYQSKVHRLRMDLARGIDGLSPFSEAHTKAALVSLRAAETSLELAILHQAQALAGAR